MIRHLSQLNTGLRNACGPACGAMIVNDVRKTDYSVRQVAEATGTADGSFTTFAELTHILKHYGVGSTFRRPMEWAYWQDLLDNRRYGIALVDYRQFSNNPGGYQYAHFVIVVGYDAERVYIHDPLRTTGPTAVTVDEFRRAIGTPSLTLEGQNLPYQGLEIDYTRTPDMTGINLDLRNPMGRPDVARLTGFTHARLLYNLSNGAGSVDIDAAEAVYRPYIQALIAARIQPVVVFTHQTWGEGQGFNWEAMTGPEWGRFRTGLVAMIARIAERYRGDALVYQIHNEQDSEDNRASVVMPADEYGALFNAAYTRIRGIDGTAQIITGGHNSGPGLGGAYFVASHIALTDGVAIHPYGAGAGGLFELFGTIDEQLREWRRFVPSNVPLWVTEYGLTNAHHEPELKVAQYARAFRAACNGKTRAPMWYAWSDFMDNSYGVVSNAGQERPDLRTALTMAVVTEPVVGVPAGLYTLNYPGGRVNVRSAANTGASVLATVGHGEAVDILSNDATYDGRWTWQQVRTGGVTGYMATKGGAWTFTSRDDNHEAWLMVLDAYEKLYEAYSMLNDAMTKAGIP